MKTAISIPDALFATAEELAESLDVSRSELYARAIAEYTERHGATAIREKLDEVYGREEGSLDEGLAMMQAISIPPETW
ncbi:MAG TPA: hypothetical protein VM557_02035 [Thermoanaerobaculia bacterium]|nr:hypothetical protein [Thermoanaerobaculia bacterium]